MDRRAVAIALFALVLTAALGAYALQPAAPDTGSDLPAPSVAPDSGGTEIGLDIQKAANMTCTRLRPHAVDDFWTTSKNTPITASPLANDPDNEQNNFGGLGSQPSHGTAEVVGLDAVKYTPDTNFVGSDSFTYFHVGCLQCFQGWCSEPDTDEGTVFVTVTE